MHFPKVAFGYLNLDLNFKVMDLICLTSKSIYIKVCLKDF